MTVTIADLGRPIGTESQTELHKGVEWQKNIDVGKQTILLTSDFFNWL